jgi:hypothetical protein
MPVIGKPEALVRVIVGPVAKTSDPVPVSSVTVAARLAEVGVPRKVATPDPRAESPVPPLPAARGVASVSEVNAVVTSTTVVPSLKTQVVLPTGTAIPAVAEFFMVITPSVEFLTM